MNRKERAHVERIRNSADALLKAKTRGQEHASRYMLTVSIRQLIDWTEGQSVGTEGGTTRQGTATAETVGSAGSGASPQREVGDNCV